MTTTWAALVVLALAAGCATTEVQPASSPGTGGAAPATGVAAPATGGAENRATGAAMTDEERCTRAGGVWRAEMCEVAGSGGGGGGGY